MTAKLKEIFAQEKTITEYDFFKRIIAKPFVEAVYLYGSRGRGDNREDSDFDLGVFCPDASEKEWEELTAMVRSNEEILLRVDVKRIDAITTKSFLGRVIRDRKLLYLRDNASEKSNLTENLSFIKEWNEKMTGWSIHINYLIFRAGEPDDVTIKETLTGFHHAFNSAWVLFRKCLSLHGMRTNTPLSTFREAYMEGWIDNRVVWEMMVEDFYNTWDVDDNDARRRVYPRLPMYIETLLKAGDSITQLIKPYEYAQKN